MKYILFSLLTLFTFNLFSQDSQKSLLWEITNPNTQKTSYLYGTMHISGRLAFHLGEEFFDAIEEVDAVALESNPIIWLDEIFASPYADDYLGKYGFRYQTYKGFYQSAFELTIPENKDLNKAISGDHYLSNWMLYRENKSKLDFQEETFLDLFIYQAGLKSGKKVYSLENFSQTTHFSKMGSMSDPEKKETDAWYDKLTEDENANELIKEAYRNKDVLLLDSLHSQVNSDNFMKWMLDVRNDIMATRIDSFIQKENTSLFIGIGAAHLAGEKGVINYLRKLGYTVEPMTTTITDKAKDKKEAYDKKKRKIEYTTQFESEMFSLKIPGKMYETPSGAYYQRQFFSPELTNGSYFSVKLLSTYSYFSKVKQNHFIEKIDSILFESIPGDILSKKSITKQGYNGLDIINKTTTGNYQRYQIILTPLNIIIFKMGGKDSFVKDMGDGFFNSIQLKKQTDKWVKFKSIKNDFEVDLPNFYSAKGNTHITALYEQIELEAYDKKDKNYYFLKRASLYDFQFIEEDNYELDRIADQFCEGLDIDSVDVTILKDTKFPTAIASTLTADSNYMEMKIVIRGAFYYLLANVSSYKRESNSFFDSFKFNNWKYDFESEQKVDSTLLFTTKSNYLYPNIYTDLYTKAYQIRQKNIKKTKEDNSFKSYNEERNYYSENYERINVLMYKFHDYAEYEDIDSLWSSEIKLISKTNKLILHRKTTKKENGMYYMEADFTDTNSCRMIKSKYILKHGAMYSLLTTLDTIEKPNQFINNFYDSFKPLDTLIGISIFEDKSQRFFKNINSSDSLTRVQAFESAKSHIKFDETDVDQLMDVIINYNFPSKHIQVKKQLIADLGKIDDKRVVPFLVDLYPVVEDTAMYQLAILNGLANQKTKKAYEAFTKLLDYDIPLSSNKWGVSYIFYPFYDSLSLTKEIFPDVLNFSFVQDYRSPTYRLLSSMIRKDAIKGKSYKKQYKQILREAKIELKSQISYEQSEQGKKKGRYYYSSYKNKGNDLLVNYSTLLIPFYKKSAVQEYFLKLQKVQDYIVQTDIYCLLASKGLNVPQGIWGKLAEDNTNRNYLYKRLKYYNLLDLYPQQYKTQKLMVESLLYDKSFDIEKDSMQFVNKFEITVQNKTGYVYFYKSKGEKDDDWELDYVGLQPSDTTEVNTSKFIREKGIEIEKHKTIDEIIEDELESIQLEGHKRAKKRSSGNNYGWFW